MIGIFNTITIDGMEFPKPDHEFSREDVYAGEYTTCTGRTIADRIGWKYSDQEINFDALTDAQAMKLAGIRGAVTLKWEDADGEHTETIIRRKFKNTPTRSIVKGVPKWRDVSIEVSFLNVHN